MRMSEQFIWWKRWVNVYFRVKFQNFVYCQFNYLIVIHCKIVQYLLRQKRWTAPTQQNELERRGDATDLSDGPGGFMFNKNLQETKDYSTLDSRGEATIV